ncbi:hypothetical protein [Winogradskyella alexanderae]|uniref:Cardiolipin synthase N-terminal domain-containing protein n=1 Tax=Winogradskyella alexanderae TaxID=2877123 RepID=A0ABS7XU43_9FLAO|nr:hypothetical protein [Winogradskyella alexanderae]MCA0132989.1 hypothetical protein [Winogradskyella alexanderae]
MDIVLSDTVSQILMITFLLIHALLAIYVVFSEIKNRENRFLSAIWILASIFIPLVPGLVYLVYKKAFNRKELRY